MIIVRCAKRSVYCRDKGNFLMAERLLEVVATRRGIYCSRVDSILVAVKSQYTIKDRELPSGAES